MSIAKDNRKVRQLRKGFVSGIALSLLIAGSIVLFSKQGDAQSGSQTIWSGLLQGVAMTTSDTAASTAAATPASAVPNPRQYAALGDSVAAGLGLPYVEGATPQDQRCGRSSQSYAFIAGQQLGLSTGLYACSAAKSGDLYTRQWINNFNPKIQIDQAFADGAPQLLSITVGANDIGWSSLVRQCYYATCGSQYQTSRVESKLTTIDRNLSVALQQISSRGGSRQPQVILTGYYNPVSEACVARYPDRITSQEIAWVNNGVQQLNQLLQSVAQSHSQFVRFAPVDFTGHDICSTDPWVQGLTDSAPIHPTVNGQQAIANAIVRAY